jgi:hypothetical protein
LHACGAEPAAERDRDFGTLARAMRGCRRLGVEENSEHRFLRAVSNERLEHACRVARAARAGIVLRVRENDRASRCAGNAHRFLNGRVGLEQRLRKLGLAQSEVARHRIRRRVGLGLGVRVHDHRRSAMEEI